MNESAPIRLLVVDDDDTLRMNLDAYFEDEGFDVSTAATGEDGIEQVKTRTFDVVLCDMRLPGMDGNQTILAMHQLAPQLRFLVYTGSPKYQLEDALEAIGVTRSQLFRKPLRDMGLLADAIRTLHEKGELPHEDNH